MATTQLVLVTGGDGQLWRFNGTVWEDISSQVPNSIFSGHGSVASYSDILYPYQIFCTSATDWWIGTGGESLIVHNNNGTWEAFWNGNGLSLGSSWQDIYGLWGSSPTNVYCVTEESVDRMLHYDGTWNHDTSISDGTLCSSPHQSSGLSSGQAMTGTQASGSVYVGTYGSWSSYAVASPSTRSIFWLDATHVWWGGGSSSVYFSANGGQTWASQSTGLTGSSNVNGLWAADANNVWAVTQDGQIAYYSGSWSVQLASGAGNFFNGVWGIDAENVWAVGYSSVSTAGIVFKYNPGTLSWDNITSSFPSPPTPGEELYSVWAGLSSGPTLDVPEESYRVIAIARDVIKVEFGVIAAVTPNLLTASTYQFTSLTGGAAIEAKEVLPVTGVITDHVFIVISRASTDQTYQLNIADDTLYTPDISSLIFPDIEWIHNRTKTDSVIDSLPEMYGMRYRSLIRVLLESISISDEEIGGEQSTVMRSTD